MAHYDLHGIDPVRNPGTYSFKKGLAGKKGKEVTFVGPCQLFAPSVKNRSLLLVDRVLSRMRARAASANSWLAI
jgi:hypothetical protein